MKNKANSIYDEVPPHKKKSRRKGQPRSDHKHTYETVLLTRYFHYNLGEPRVSEQTLPTKICTICGRIGETDKDESLYDVHPDPDVKRWMVWRKDLSSKALSLPKWRAEAFDKFATKTKSEDEVNPLPSL